MLARRLTTILPAMTLAEAIETTRIHRVAGLTGDRTALVTTRPFRAPHYTISDVGLIGGGHIPMPRDVSRAHKRLLLLNEPPEYKRILRSQHHRPNEFSSQDGLCNLYGEKKGQIAKVMRHPRNNQIRWFHLTRSALSRDNSGAKRTV
jgi:hypothetical protein